MKNAKFFNKFYTISEALASISLLSVLFTIFKKLNLESIVLFSLLIGLFLLLFMNSLGYFGGEKHGYGFSSFVNITSLLTLFFIMLSEIELYLYLRGFTDIVAVVILQALLIIVVLIAVMLAYLNHPPNNS
ncbi:hypothetical protein ACNF42_05715 [Cuniculiplasma sp. SKW3]|uniref:hypothetical protein n=1 Tax=Cuniculiplasma sp. SKW3 TaxID=3400170 RepID=UPI003FCF3FF4